MTVFNRWARAYAPHRPKTVLRIIMLFFIAVITLRTAFPVFEIIISI